MTRRNLHGLVSLVGLCIGIAQAPVAHAEVRLPKILSSHMVVQRDRPVHVWGWADPGERVTVTLNSATISATADKFGHWSVYLPPRVAGGPVQITVAGTNRIVLDDVLIGDVWFASGQSNMEMPLGGFPGSAVVKNAEKEISQANHPEMRLLLVRHKASAFPLADFEGDESWTACSPETAAKFSAVAYFFGREIAQHEHIPVGLIDSTWGGTPAESWVSLNGISADAALMPVFSARAQMINEQTDLSSRVALEKREDADARAKGLPPPKHPWHPDPASWDPSWLYNGMVAPALGFGIKGVIWYQGESNSGPERAPLYGKVFRTLIRDWRSRWQQGDFPFLFVQISSFNASPSEDWPAVREAQRRTLSLAETAMAVTIDVGDRDNIHPPDKQTVGNRLALAARALVYGERVEYSGPAYRQTSGENNCLRVWFDHVAEGLDAKGGAVQGFEVAGDDHRFFAATGRIEGASVLLTSSQVEQPKYVHYGWQNVPIVNLYNSAGLPASPFTSEEVIPAP
ncbi:MAG: sialate O-acetylesterase [Acidobacteriaceae bacterium]|nr:sialate O-acetylesterase [Acidobacteriaceae bacterium]